MSSPVHNAKAIRQYFDDQVKTLVATAVRAGAIEERLHLEDIPGDWIRCSRLSLAGVELGRVVVKREGKSITVRTLTEPVQ
jgi:hypothetical protein